MTDKEQEMELVYCVCSSFYVQVLKLISYCSDSELHRYQYISELRDLS